MWDVERLLLRDVRHCQKYDCLQLKAVVVTGGNSFFCQSSGYRHYFYMSRKLMQVNSVNVIDTSLGFLNEAGLVDI